MTRFPKIPIETLARMGTHAAHAPAALHDPTHLMEALFGLIYLALLLAYIKGHHRGVLIAYAVLAFVHLGSAAMGMLGLP